MRAFHMFDGDNGGDIPCAETTTKLLKVYRKWRFLFALDARRRARAAHARPLLASKIKQAKDPHAASFELFTPVFQREARFSRKQPVPQLGANADPEAVGGFHNCWHNFDSWRSFEYLDGNDEHSDVWPHWRRTIWEDLRAGAIAVDVLLDRVWTTLLHSSRPHPNPPCSPTCP